MPIKHEIKKRAKQPTTQAGLLALMIAPQIMPDVDWEAVTNAVMVLWDQLPIIVAGVGALGVWNIFRDEEMDE